MTNACEISSKSNAVIKKASLLQSSVKRRKECGQFFIEGLRLCRDAFLTGIKIDSLLVTKTAYSKNTDLIDKMSASAGISYFITEDIANKLSDTVNPQGIFCICDFIETGEFEPKPTGRYIFLENVADPSNVGAIIRTAEALGIDGAVLSKGCCDIYNPKALRASMGSIFRLAITVTQDMNELVDNLTKSGFLTAASVPDGSAERITNLDLNKGCAVIIGNEANGISDELKDVCSVVATIPMQGRAESLNAAMAASIIMWEIMRNSD